MHLNQKQNSRSAISNFKKLAAISSSTKARLAAIGSEIALSTDLDQFCILLKEHEKITAAFLNQSPVQERLFPDFDGQIKSLGAWGGDFVLAAGNKNVKAYFEKKGYPIVISYANFILG